MARIPQVKPAWLGRWLVLLPIPLVWVLFAHFGFLGRIENNLLDLRFRLRGEIPAPLKLVYVDVDTQAVEVMGERPWSRGVFADIAEVLIELGGVKAIGFDFVFSKYGRSALVDEERVKAGNAKFAKLIREHPRKLVLAAQYTPGSAITQENESAIREIPLLRKGKVNRMDNDLPEGPEPPMDVAVERLGLIDVDVERSADEVPRWVPLFVHTIGPTLLHLSLHLVLELNGIADPAAVQIGDDAIAVFKNGVRLLRIPVDQGQLLEANWFSAWQSPHNPRHSVAKLYRAVDLLESKDAQERREAEEFFRSFKDAVVLIGPVDPLLQDLAPTPFDAHPVPKVGLHGNLVKTIVTGKYLRRIPEWGEWVAILGLTLLVCGFVVAGGARGVTKHKLLVPVALVVYAGLAVLLFSWWHVVIPMAGPLGSAFTGGFVAITWQLITEQKAKGRIKGMFGAYVSPQLVDRMVDAREDPQLGGHDAEITGYFSDIQSFSSFSEKLGSGPLVELMNEYLTACTDIVQEEGGTLDKYIGDAVVAMFGAPIAMKDHAYRACVATQRVHLKLAELRDKWRGEGDKWPEIVWKMQSRIGLNTGVCMIGNMGSRTRFNYTMMGDNVNLAARMESGSKSWGVYTMVTEATRLACIEHGGDRIVFRPLGRIVVLGRSQPVPIHEVLGFKASLPTTTQRCLPLYEEALAKYYAREWDAAIELFRQSDRLEPNQPGKTPGVKTNPSRVYLGIAEEHKQHPPPEDWDGVHVMTEK